MSGPLPIVVMGSMLIGAIAGATETVAWAPRCESLLDRAHAQLVHADSAFRAAMLVRDETHVVLRFEPAPGEQFLASVTSADEPGARSNDDWYDRRPIRSANFDLDVWRSHAGLTAHLVAPGPLGADRTAAWAAVMRAALDRCLELHTTKDTP
jgi:hypothetical protein